jgi:hypothetical protein
VGVISLLGGVAEVSRHFFRPYFGREFPSDESLGPVLNRRDGDILNVIPLLGEPCLGARCGGPMLRFTNVFCCSRLILEGAMHAIADESKTMTSRYQPTSTIFFFRWIVDEIPFEVVILLRCSATVVTRLRNLA